MKKTIIVQLCIKDDVNQFLQLAKQMIKDTNNEDGCISYNLYRDVTTSNSFIFYEVFKNEEAFELHNQSSHFKTFFAQVSKMLAAEPVIQSF